MNPAVAIPAGAIAARARRTASDYLALAIATCGVGYFPIAPGTLGSLVGIGLYLPLEYSARRYLMSFPRFVVPFDAPASAVKLIVILIVTMAGIWAATRAEKLMQIKDPGIVVIDEVAGQMIALLSVPLVFPGWLPVVSAFILFRVFDIWKPYPIRRLEGLESGLGIMADDVVAGLYAAIANSVLLMGFVIFYSR